MVSLYHLVDPPETKPGFSMSLSEGKRLDEIEQKVEAGKRPYQKFLLALLTAGITLLIGMVLGWLLL